MSTFFAAAAGLAALILIAIGVAAWALCHAMDVLCQEEERWESDQTEDHWERRAGKGS